MTLRLRHLRLRASTTDGPYGADVEYASGLTVLWADNTKGKSTCMQGMLYALGLERMLSPRREIPLPHAMTSYVSTDDGKSHAVLASHVALEVENGAGQVITITRGVKSETDGRLITVDFGGILTDPSVQAKQANYFVLDPGAATREDGFHFFLEAFLGWSLPDVRRYDLPDTKLYLETIFPLFWVEQKAGWSSIPAAIPTYFRIKEVQRRVVEFLLDLDAHKLELRRQQIIDDIAMTARAWRAQWDELDGLAKRNGARIDVLPSSPTITAEDISRGFLSAATADGWISMDDALRRLRTRINELQAGSPPTVTESSDEAQVELSRLSSEIDELNAERIKLYRIRQLRVADIESISRRLETLKEDLQKNSDVQKLERYSGTSVDLSPDHCPTCEQTLEDTLLSQRIVSAVMPISDNIEYLKSQIRMFSDILSREEEALSASNEEVFVTDNRLAELFARVRTIRADLVSPGTGPSVAMIEERVRAENRTRDLDNLQTAFDATQETLLALRDHYESLLAERSASPQNGMTTSDKDKLTGLANLLKDQAGEYGFSTFGADELSISDDTYRPQKEGFEIGFEISASDAIRLKWAYQLGLLELAATHETNHPHLLLFDEPRQQETAKLSFESLLRRAAMAKDRGQQIVFSTSEDLEALTQITASLECKVVVFDGYIIQKLKPS